MKTKQGKFLKYFFLAFYISFHRESEPMHWWIEEGEILAGKDIGGVIKLLKVFLCFL